MKQLHLLTILLLLSFTSLSAQGAADSTPSPKGITEKTCLENTLIELKSDVLNETRKVKIRLPDGYSSEAKYPVVYITDANYNFELAASYLNQLSKSGSIPANILVGIVQNDRGNELDIFWEAGGPAFRDHLFKELVPFIDAKYATTGFNTLIGHSDGAEFNHLLMLEKDNPFRAFISLSEALNNDVSDRIARHFKTYAGGKSYYFIASARYDSPDRVEAGKSIAKSCQSNTNTRIAFEHKMYRADHQNLPSVSLLDGILFVFSDYRNLTAYDGFKAYAASYKQTIADNYGFTPEYNIDDVDYFFGNILDNKDLEMYPVIADFAAKNGLFEVSTYSKAWHYYKMDEHETSLRYWNEVLDDFGDTSPRIFSLNFKLAIESYLALNNPSGAITFLEKCKKVLPDYTLEFNYFIAKVSHENNVAADKGKQALAYCEANYKENEYFKPGDLAKLK